MSVNIHWVSAGIKPITPIRSRTFAPRASPFWCCCWCPCLAYGMRCMCRVRKMQQWVVGFVERQLALLRKKQMGFIIRTWKDHVVICFFFFSKVFWMYVLSCKYWVIEVDASLKIKETTPVRALTFEPSGFLAPKIPRIWRIRGRRKCCNHLCWCWSLVLLVSVLTWSPFGAPWLLQIFLIRWQIWKKNGRDGLDQRPGHILET